MGSEPIYRVVFVNRDRVYEIYAEEVSQGTIVGFVEIGGLLFGQRSKVVIDPAEEQLQREFEGVRRFSVPMHAVIRIDEVDDRGTPRIHDRPEGKGSVASFPVPVSDPPKGGDG